MAHSRSNVQAATQTALPEHQGIQQFGDIALYNESNVHLIGTRILEPEDEVGPNDLVYKPDPSKRFKFYRYQDARTLDSEGEYHRLTRKGYFKCTEDLFTSPSERYQATNGVFGVGAFHIWMAIPEEKHVVNKSSQLRYADGIIEGLNSSMATEGAKAGVAVTSEMNVVPRTRE